jgi:hypothetical protein
MKIIALWDIASCSLCSLVDAPLKRRSASTRLHGAISQKVVIFILAAVRTLSITFCYTVCSLFNDAVSVAKTI